ncbi:MAG: hypothetical protein DRH15_07685, partial [Deltaproteobacteria bacterium]
GLGYKNRNGLLGVEHFLGDIHAAMAFIKSLHRSLLKAHLPRSKSKGKQQEIKRGIKLTNGELYFTSPRHILSNPQLLMDIFVASSSHGAPLSLEAKRLVREFLFLVDEKFKGSKESARAFFTILAHPSASDTFDIMLETDFLGAFIPEFNSIKDRVQFDIYHIYPVGRHSLQTLRELKALPKEGDVILTTIFSELSQPEHLLLASLFHDIGKKGKNHAIRGAEITKKILERLGYDKAGMEEVLFIGRHQVWVAETAMRRDIDDEKVVVQCARTIGTIERLKMLYLLTWADGRATGPRAWNTWIGNLVQELFFKVLHILTHTELATDDAESKIKRTKALVARRLSPGIPKEELRESFEVMSPRYLLNTPPSAVARHIFLRKALQKAFSKKGPTAFILEPEYQEAESCWNLTFLGRDRPGLFSDIAGVMALNNINILSARIYTWSDGTAVDLFQVTGPLDKIHPERTWEKLRKDLGQVFEGKVSLSLKLKGKSSPSLLSKSFRPPKEPHVIIDNEASDFFTLIEVIANDRVGLLYSITKILFELQLDVCIAKIATKADQVADVFYVRDFLGQKVESKERVKEIRSALLAELRSHPPPP